MARYLFDHGWESELQRLTNLEAVFDPATIRHLDALGVPRGGRCLEVGAGAGSIARWLCQMVGPDGTVAATDVETDFLERLTEPNIDVRRHDIVCDDLEVGTYDVIHARLVLEHLPEREVCLKRLTAALAPGGVLVVEDFDWASAGAVSEDVAPLFNRVLAAVRETMRSAGYDDAFGRRLPGLLRQAGLVEVGAEGRVPFVQAGSAEAAWWSMSVARLREPVLARAAVPEEDLERYMRLLSEPDFSFLFLNLVTAWGRRPVTDTPPV